MKLGLTLALSLMAVTAAFAAAPQPKLFGDTRIHDPSVIETGGEFAAFGTGGRGRSAARTSPDGLVWTGAGAIGKGVAA